jgi:hypothetical protein
VLQELEFPFLTETACIAPARPKATRKVPSEPAPSRNSGRNFASELREFKDFGEQTREIVVTSSDEIVSVPGFVNEFWTAGQRAANNLHEISYRACFKPQLPRFFTERLTEPGEIVYDPFMGRGTTLLEAALLGRVPAGNDVNPLSRMLLEPRLNPPTLPEIARRLEEIPWTAPVPEAAGDVEAELQRDLLVFYHPETLREIIALKNYLQDRSLTGSLDATDRWIRMTALNRLTGHSGGFFSVYTLPPNQAVSIKSQRKINETRKQIPPRRDVPALIFKKSKSLLKDTNQLENQKISALGAKAILVTGPASSTSAIPEGSVALVVTSPPFLDVVDYAGDNWLRCWFAGIDPKSVALTIPKKLDAWAESMTTVFQELHRVLKPGGHVAFEVGEVRSGTIKLEETVLTCGKSAGLTPVLVLINAQEFTKTANCWGVDNNAKGTNSNRIVLFRK